VRHRHKTKIRQRKNVNNRARKWWISPFYHKSDLSCEIMHIPEMLSKLCIGHIIMVFLFYRHSLCWCARVSNACSTWLIFMKASVVGRQVQRNTKHASSLVAAELITDGALTAQLTRDFGPPLYYRDAFGFASRLFSFLRISWIILDDSSCILYRIAYHFSLIWSRDCCYEQDMRILFDFQHLFYMVKIIMNCVKYDYIIFI